MERQELILLIAGFIISDTKGMIDWFIKIDNFLFSYNQPPLTEDEKKTLDLVYEEAWVILKTNGLNRADFRDIGFKRK